MEGAQFTENNNLTTKGLYVTLFTSYFSPYYVFLSFHKMLEKHLSSTDIRISCKCILLALGSVSVHVTDTIGENTILSPVRDCASKCQGCLLLHSFTTQLPLKAISSYMSKLFASLIFLFL